MNIRQANPEKSEHIAPLVYEAIHEIGYSLTGTTNHEQMLAYLAMWIEKPNNRLSYENIWVADVEGELAGVIIAYHGKNADALDQPIRDWLIAKGHTGNLDIETGGDVLYIDSVTVAKAFRGQGIGTELIQHMYRVAEARMIPAVTLNVDKMNSAAARLYSRLGFKKEREIEISGARFDYMVKVMQHR